MTFKTLGLIACCVVGAGGLLLFISGALGYWAMRAGGPSTADREAVGGDQ